MNTGGYDPQSYPQPIPPGPAQPEPPGFRPAALVAIAVLLAVVAGGAWWFVLRDDSSNGTVTTAPAFVNLGGLANQVDELGFGCTDYAADASTGDDFELGSPPLETGTCTVEGISVELTLYEDAAHQEQALGAAEGIGCSFAKEFGITEFHFVNGNLWVISPEDNLDVEIVERLARALDAEAKTVSC